MKIGLSAKLRWVVALGLCSGLACNDVIEHPETALFDMSVAEDPWGDGPFTPLEGVEVCVGESGDCVLSGPSGGFTLELPVGEEIYYTLQKDDYDSQLVPYVMPAGGDPTLPWGLVSVEDEAEIRQAVGVPYPRSGTGDIIIWTQPAKPGVTFDLRGATGDPYYALSPYEYPYISLDLEATTEKGFGGFFNVRPGPFRVVLGGTADSCVPTFGGWPDDAVNSVRFPVLEDHYTVLTVRCLPPP